MVLLPLYYGGNAPPRHTFCLTSYEAVLSILQPFILNILTQHIMESCYVRYQIYKYSMKLKILNCKVEFLILGCVLTILHYNISISAKYLSYTGKFYVHICVRILNVAWLTISARFLVLRDRISLSLKPICQRRDNCDSIVPPYKNSH